MRDKAAKTILCVDDNSARLQANCRVLRENGYDVIASENTSHSLRLIVDHKPDVVILDDSNLLSDVKNEISLRHTLALQILENQSETAAAQTDAFLKEPFSPGELIASVNLLVRLSEAEKKTVEQENLIQSIVKTATTIFYVYNLETHCNEYLTPNAAEVLGFTGDEVNRSGGRFVENFMHPDDAKRLPEHFSALEKIRDGEILEIDYRMRHRSGEWIWFRSRDSVLSRAAVSGAPERILGVAAEINSQKQPYSRSLLQHRIAQILSEAQTIEEAAPQILETICRDLNLRVGEFWRFDETKKVLRLENVWHSPSPQLEKFAAASRALELSAGEDLPGKVLAGGSVFWVEHLSAEEVFPRQVAVAEAELQSAFAFPVLSGEKVPGVFCFFSSERRETDKALVQMFGATGSHIGQFVKRRATEKKLRESEERYSAFVRQSTEGIWRLEFDKEFPVELPFDEQVEFAFGHAFIAECNDAVAQMYGLEKAEDLIGRRLSELFDRGGSSNLNYFRAFVESNYRLTGAESHEIDVNGNDKYFLNSLVGLVEDGHLRQIWGTQVDVTRQKLAEDALRASEKRYRELFNSIDEGFCVCEMIFDDDGKPYDYRFLEINPTFSAHTGLYDPVGKTARELLPALEEHWFETYGRVVSTGESVRFVNGSETMGRWFDVYAFRTGNAEERKFALLFNDITERRRAEAALIAAERKGAEDYQELLSRIVPLAQALGISRDLLTVYRRILEFTRASMPCVGFFISTYDEKTNQKFAVYAWAEGEEIDITTLPSMPVTEDGGPNSRAILSGETQVVERYAEHIKNRPHAVLRDNGRHPEVSLVVPMVVMGRVTGTFEVQAYEGDSFQAEQIIAFEMVANLAAAAIENVRLLESEAQARRDSEIANRAKDEFIAVVSHELRSPLNAMLGWARILQNPKIAESNKEQALDTIIRNARTQSKLIEDLLDTSRITSGKLRLELKQVNLPQVIKDVMEVSKPSAQAKNISISEDLDPKVDLISGDPDRLQQIVGNLLSNAVKFTPPGGSIQVELKRADSYALITIKDSGVGIDPKFLPKIFEQFSQSDPASTRRHGGLGLGLALARRLAEMHGGTITAESDGAGKGAAFIVSLPLR